MSTLKKPWRRNYKRELDAVTQPGSLHPVVGRPVEFHVKGSEWKKMPAKTKAALAEMVKCVAKMVQGPRCPRCASYRVQQIGVKRWHCCSCQKRWSVRTPNAEVSHGG